MIQPSENKEYIHLHSPVKMPKASSLLWNKKMAIQMSCRGYATAYYLQPEPTKYSHSPIFVGKLDIFPEQPYYAHHPGRFIYLKDEETGKIFSAPYEPVRALPDSFTFSAGKNDILWKVIFDGVSVEMSLSIPTDDALELWTIKVINNSSRQRKISIYPYFTVGYMSWMNQEGSFNENLCAVVCSSVTPYRKYQDYFKNKDLKDKTFLLADRKPTSWEANQEVFEGEGGLHNPSGVQQTELSKTDARYETPVCVFQYRIELKTGSAEEYRFIFGPAKDEQEISEYKSRYFNKADGFTQAKAEYNEYVGKGKGCLKISTPDAEFDNFINHWLPRQIFYHGTTNRLTTDPQTRNYVQDNMGMSYINPEVTRKAFTLALSQQEPNGCMPEGILLHQEAELKFINLIPHADHSVWIPICLKAYLDETNDVKFLSELVPFGKEQQMISVFEHIDMAMDWLLKNRDERGLSYIHQGDWCDPMNMVGYKGKGVSGWLSLATAYALNVWAEMCEQNGRQVQAKKFYAYADEINAAINKHLWDGNWYAYGITDDNIPFGIAKDPQGRIYLNPQGWSLLSGCADKSQQKSLINAVKEQLETRYGVELQAPPYTSMREDIGRVTQKYPGMAENCSVYNHACAFYIYGLYTVGEKDNAWRLIRKMLPGPDMEDVLKRGQLPVFIPNYYRGASKLYPRTTGRSSQLFNTGTVSWLYRCLIDGLFGLQGNSKGLSIHPQLPSTWDKAGVTRFFRGAEFNVEITRIPGIEKTEVKVDGKSLLNPVIENIEPGKKYLVQVSIP
jgi:cellobionic acid phosphorylase